MLVTSEAYQQQNGALSNQLVDMERREGVLGERVNLLIRESEYYSYTSHPLIWEVQICPLLLSDPLCVGQIHLFDTKGE
jgi:hypothetical protein